MILKEKHLNFSHFETFVKCYILLLSNHLTDHKNKKPASSAGLGSLNSESNKRSYLN
jgi:hypothetical protein